ncbi:UxaA family hydrolase [Gilvimarinus polysaccharolyticus]|uniref:UxaA family hydrolase n=1 Tax=Gilvimarinus polysaccharolyticus TaxID=863921 RepID=UPI000673B318|nr:UxaA family hydrolase [Gilvimarinus polysaccharolyticus]
MTSLAGPLQLLLLHPADNVLISVQNLCAGTKVEVEGLCYQMVEPIPVGYKVARFDLSVGTKIMRYGVPIGSLFHPVKAGGLVHLHNLQSDYLASHTRQSVIQQNPYRSNSGE